MGTSRNLKLSYTLLPLHISWSSIPCSTYSLFALQTSDIWNHVVWATNSCFFTYFFHMLFCASSTECTRPHAHIQTINCNIIPQKDAMIPYMDQTYHPLNSRVLAKFFPSATISSTLSYSEFTVISFLQSIIGYCFCCISWLTSFFRPPFSHLQPLSQSPSHFSPLSNHRTYQQPLFHFLAIHPTSPLCTVNQQQNNILKSSQIFTTVW